MTNYEYLISSPWRRNDNWNIKGRVEAPNKIEAVKVLCNKYQVDPDFVLSVKPMSNHASS